MPSVCYDLFLFWIYFMSPYSVKFADSFNVDVTSPVIYSGPKGSYFGYSVALLKNEEGVWILVGTPKGEDQFQPLIRRPGALYKCRYPPSNITSCEQINVDSTGDSEQSLLFHRRKIVFHHDKSDQWLGVSLDVEPTGHSSVVVCAHRWRDSYLLRKLNGITHMNGLCYQLNGSLTSPGRLIPALTMLERLVHQDGYAEFSMGTLGMSAQFTGYNDFLALGSPGLNDWSGGAVIERQGNLSSDLRYVEPQRQFHQDSYIGYSITTAYFIYRNSKSLALGAPRTEKVMIYSGLSSPRGNPRTVLNGEQIGSYFGASLLAVDINNDQLDDLIVGAPMYADTTSHSSSAVDQGRVYIFLSRGFAGFRQTSTYLDGNKKSYARFGSALANLGDINSDGFSDIIVGTPYEDEGTGCIYIYNGCSSGIWPEYTQRIAALQFSNLLSGFGISFSKTMDIDENGLKDFAVGSYNSDNALLLHVRPVVHVVPRFVIYPAKYTEDYTCDVMRMSVPCIQVMVCFFPKFTTAEPLRKIGLNYTLKFNTTRSLEPPYASVFAYSRENARNLTQISDNITLQGNTQQCSKPHVVYVQHAAVGEDLQIEVEYEYQNDVCDTEVCPVINMFDGKSEEPTLQNRYTEKVLHKGKCGEDESCVANVSFKTNFIYPATDGSSFIPNIDPKFIIQVHIQNSGKMAQNVKIIQSFPSFLVFKNAYDISSKREYFCAYTEDVGYNNLTCYVQNIEESVTLSLQYFSKGLTFDESLIISTSLSTSSSNTGVANETRVIVPVKYASDVALVGRSVPQNMLLRVNGTTEGSETETITHQYMLYNNGPLDIYHGVLQIHLPSLLSNVFISGILAEAIYSNSSVDCEHEINSTAIGTNHANITCQKYPCDTVLCHVKGLWIGSAVKITTNITYKKYTFGQSSGSECLAYVSESSFSHHSNGTDLSTSLPSFEISTQICPIQWSTFDGRVHYWIILVSIISGFLVILLLAFVMFRCGFFQRKYKERLDKMKQTKNLLLARNYNNGDVILVNDCDNESETSVMIPPPSYREVRHICEPGSNIQTYTPMGVNNVVYLEPIQSL